MRLTPAQKRLLRVLEHFDRYDDPANPYRDDPIYFFTDDGREVRTLRHLPDGAAEVWQDIDNERRWYAALYPKGEGDAGQQRA